jgi:hypothetical protein
MDYHPTMIILISITEYQLARLQGYNQVNIYISIYLYLYLYIYISIDRSQKETHCFLKQTKLSIFSFIKLENRRTKLVLPVALVVVGRGRSGERVYDGGYGANTVYNLCKWRNETYKLVQEWWEQGYRRMVLGEN